MATFTEKILVKIDVLAEQGVKGLKDFRKSVSEAEGVTGKLKAGTSALGGVFKAASASPTVMAGAVTAAGTAAFAAVSNYADLGLEIGKFSEATGLSAEQASRWVEVANDAAVDTGSLQTSLNKLNKTIDPTLFASLGIEIAKTASGATDVNGTFLNVIDKLKGIQDPAERARLGTQLLGKSWGDLAELVARGSGSLSKSLADVSDIKVYDNGKVNQARQFRDMLDQLRDTGEELALQIGKELLPTVVAVGKAAAVAAKGVGYLDAAARGLAGVGEISGTEMRNLYHDITALGDGFYKSDYAVKNSIKSYEDILVLMQTGKLDFPAVRKTVDDLTAAHNAAAKATEGHGSAAQQAADYIDFLKGRVQANTDAIKDDEDATKRAKDATHDLAKAIKDLNDIQLDSIATRLDVVTQSMDLMQAQDDYNKSVDDGKRPVSELASAANDLAQKQADLAKQQGIANGHTQTAAERTDILMSKYNDLQKTLEPGSALWNAIEDYKKALLSIPTNVSTRISITGAGAGNAGRLAPGAGQGPDGTATGSVSSGAPTVNVNVRSMPTQRELTEFINTTRRRQGPVI